MITFKKKKKQQQRQQQKKNGNEMLPSGVTSDNSQPPLKQTRPQSVLRTGETQRVGVLEL